MWLVGVTCLVDIISSSTSTVNVLVEEFEAASGRRVLVQILTGTCVLNSDLVPNIKILKRKNGIFPVSFLVSNNAP